MIKKIFSTKSGKNRQTIRLVFSTEVSRYLRALLNKEAFDRAGLIYGMGHAVYSLSDPRAVIFHSFVERLSAEREKRKNLHCTLL